MAKARWTRETAIEYLASNPNFTPQKAISSYTTPYLKRTATAFQDAEQAGRRAPTSAERRGHARAKVKHLSAHPEKHILDQYRVFRPKDREIDLPDLNNLYKRASRGKKPTDEVLVYITGVGIASPRFREKWKPDEVHTYSYSLNLKNLKNLLGLMEEVEGDMIFDFAYEISLLQWEEVHMISFGFPNT